MKTKRLAVGFGAVLLFGLSLMPVSGQRANELRRAGKTPAPVRAELVVVEQPVNQSCLGDVCAQLVKSFDEYWATLGKGVASHRQQGVASHPFTVTPVVVSNANSKDTAILFVVLTGPNVKVGPMGGSIFAQFDKPVVATQSTKVCVDIGSTPTCVQLFNNIGEFFNSIPKSGQQQVDFRMVSVTSGDSKTAATAVITGADISVPSAEADINFLQLFNRGQEEPAGVASVDFESCGASAGSNCQHCMFARRDVTCFCVCCGGGWGNCGCDCLNYE